jgi:FlaA1/EpsC-like NDP-sugar epimerase
MAEPIGSKRIPLWEAGARWYRARPWCQVLGDVFIVNLAVLLAFSLRYNAFPPPTMALAGLWVFAPALTLLRILCLIRFNLYRIHWRFVGLHELRALLWSTTVSSLLFYALLMLCRRWDFPRGVLIIDWLLNVFLVGGLRISYRLTLATGRRGLGSTTMRRVLLIGAGIHGEALAREMMQRRGSDLRPVGFLDDAPLKQGLIIQGLPVLGSVDQVAVVTAARRVDEVVIAIPSSSGPQIRRIVGLCESLPVRLRISPGYRQLTGANAAAALRDLSVEDLLRRPPVRIDGAEVAGYLTGERVLITGAGGSIGAELCRQVATMHPEAILLLGRGENSIFQIHQELRERDFEAVPLLADIRDRAHLEQIFRRHRPTVIFHAAAHKHVPLMEAHPEEAVTNNILGTRNMARLANEWGVKRFVMISTDKAVNPTSVMGASKRVAELVVQAEAARSRGTRFMAVRFGNVLGSRGSVVPSMRRMIQQGGPVTVTHPEMVRFFMTIPEAVLLVLQAGALGGAGEIFMLDMGDPVKIVDLARDLIRLSGLVPDKDIAIRFTGLRPGEKLYEELLTATEDAGVTRHEKIFAAAPMPIDAAALDAAVEVLAGLAAEGDTDEIRALLRMVVPTYHIQPPIPLPEPQIGIHHRDTETQRVGR